MDITSSAPPAPATRPCALPHSAPASWLRSAAPEAERRPPYEPAPDDMRRGQMRHHMHELERLSRELGENRATRMGGWTPFNRRLFLDILADTGKVSHACDCVDLSKQSAYALRARDPVFAAGWNAAAELARDALADSVLERALAGSTETVTRNGEVAAERHRHDGRLAMAVLARLDRRCDRSAAEGGAHVRAMAEWDRFLGLVGDGDDAAAGELLAPPPAANDGQPSQPWGTRARAGVARSGKRGMADHPCLARRRPGRGGPARRPALHRGGRGAARPLLRQRGGRAGRAGRRARHLLRRTEHRAGRGGGCGGGGE